jgi:hypothetical protein
MPDGGWARLALLPASFEVEADADQFDCADRRESADDGEARDEEPSTDEDPVVGSPRDQFSQVIARRRARRGGAI